ncbi:MAG: hypothetical protein M1821_004559 [Bathelium mastoideum]|nr:MAG: hypothetical protein M1821_004559 [Bathelium mastoideum]
MAKTNLYEDHSGVTSGNYDNPYDALIEASHNDASKLQTIYDRHRRARIEQQKGKLLDPSFAGVTPDSVLQRLHYPEIEPGFRDTRHCLVFWARPPQKLKNLITHIQQQLRAVLPNMWFMPAENLHLTCLEVTFSRTDEEIGQLVKQISPKAVEITDYTYTHQARLIKPILGFDASAFALSFLPAAGEGLSQGRKKAEDEYTYHHLRRDVYTLVKDTGVEIGSRYTVPSSHLTIGRFITPQDTSKDAEKGVDASIPDPEKMEKVVEKINALNEWLQEVYWPRDASPPIREGGEWIVGEEKGLDFHQGTLWYGKGECIRLGKGF